MQLIKLAWLAVLLVLCSWYTMLAMHELGHVLGAVATGGKVAKVVLDPWAISRTDIAPNPNPAVVVWCGPIIGCALPLSLFVAVPQRLTMLHGVLGFVSGFCLIANGAYIGLGASDAVGDCLAMLQSGTPTWVMITFGVSATGLGLAVWHHLGSPRELVGRFSMITTRWILSLSALLVAYLAAVATFFPQ